MADNQTRKYTQTIDYLEDLVGADIPADRLKVALQAIEDPAASDGVPVDLQQIGDTQQSGADLMAVLQSVSADDELRTRLFGVDDAGNLAEVQLEELGTALGGTETAAVTKLSEVLETVANTEARVSVYAEDANGNLNEIQAEEINTALGGAETGVVTTTARALAEVGGTEVRTRTLGLDDGGTLQEAQVEALNTGVAAGTFGLLTYPSRALQSQAADELRSRIHDSTGTQIDPLARQDTSPVTGSTSTAGSDVTLTLGDYRKDVDWFVDVSGAATLTVEVRTSGGTWRTFDTVDYGSATTQVEQYSTAFAEIRASVDANLNTLEGSAKGV